MSLVQEWKKTSYPFKVDHLKYWSSQPVPVFAALVPLESWPVKQNPKIYIVPITNLLLFELNVDKMKHKTKSLKSQWMWMSGDNQKIQAFLNIIVQTTTAQMGCKKGVIMPCPQLTPQYIRRTPAFPVKKFDKNITRQIGHTAAMSIINLYVYDQIDTTTKDFRGRMTQILESYADDEHWETQVARAISYHIDGKFSEAIDLYEQAKGIIDHDNNFSRDSKQKYLFWIDNLIPSASAQKSLPQFNQKS